MRHLLLSVFIVLLGLTGIGSVNAQAYPNRAIKLIVPFPPGGLIDNVARLISPELSKELGQAIVIENKPGAGGNLGATDVARAAPDGYTLLMASAPLSINPALYKSLPYNPANLEPVAIFGQLPNVLLVSPESGITSVNDLVKRAKSAPGKINYASNGNGTSLHLSAELLKNQAGIFVKDLGIVLDMARASKFPLPLSSTAHQMFMQASTAGFAKEDDSAVIKIFPGIDLPKGSQ